MHVLCKHVIYWNKFKAQQSVTFNQFVHLFDKNIYSDNRFRVEMTAEN